ncbi:MAG: MarR family winged helix-turn-helix transcriptional regulator [Christensenellales bacterium]
MDNLEEILIEVLSKAYLKIIYSEEQILKDMIGETLSIKEFHTLEVIYATMQTKTNTASNVAKNLGITLGTCTTNIERLTQKGLVHKVKKDDDRRIVYIELTEKGMQTHLKHISIHKKVIGKAISKLSMSEKVALMNAINKIEL